MTLKLLIALAVLVITGTSLYHTFKPLPPGIRYEGADVPLVDPRLHTDTTVHHGGESPRFEHEIFDEMLRMIGQARTFILLDMFLFNATQPEGVQHRPLSAELTQALLERHAQVEDLSIVIITDPINTMYGGTISPWFEKLEKAGIPVIQTRLERLRDSNPIWSGLWRVCFQWAGNSPRGGWLPSALVNQPVTLRSYLALPNFKANHRKVLVVDKGDGFRGLVSSANPHDGSSRHSNVALGFSGPAVIDLLKSERSVVAMSGGDTQAIDRIIDAAAKRSQPLPSDVGDSTARVLTESAIRDAALEMIAGTTAGDRLDLAIFYLSHREVVSALIAARKRSVAVRVLLDPNKEAFGYNKSGVPNRQVAMELTRAGIDVRWCHTRGEQCHSKLLIRTDTDGSTQLLLGSANFTRRNLDDLNLETSVHVRTDSESALAHEASEFVNRQWRHGPGKPPVMSLPYETHADESKLRYWQYRLMEATGLSTF